MYALYVICCAVNGIAEAYAFAKSDSEKIAKLRNFMMVNSIVYLGACYLFAVEPGFFGFKGLIYANCLNMIMRATSSLYFAMAHYSEFVAPAGSRTSIGFFGNFKATAKWILVEIFFGQKFILIVSAGSALVVVMHFEVFPFVLGSLWQIEP